MPNVAPADVAHMVSGWTPWSISMSCTPAVNSPRIPPPSSTSPSVHFPFFSCKAIRQQMYKISGSVLSSVSPYLSTILIHSFQPVRRAMSKRREIGMSSS